MAVFSGITLPKRAFCLKYILYSCIQFPGMCGRKCCRKRFIQTILFGLPISLLLWAKPLLAENNCTSQPSCIDLGYSQTISAGCPEDDILLCPFDVTYKKCLIPACATLGFTTDSKSAWCSHVISCPTDAAYTACTAVTDCSGYPLTSCPAGASSCEKCTKGSTTSYKVNGCKNGYTLSGNTCVAKDCSSYSLSSCPANGYCSSCYNGTKYTYKLDSCKTNFVVDYNTCYDCAANYNKNINAANIAAKTYRKCADTSSSGPCRSSCSQSNKYGSYSDGCLTMGAGSSDYAKCINTMQPVFNTNNIHNQKGCPSAYTLPLTSPSGNCTKGVVNGSITQIGTT